MRASIVLSEDKRDHLEKYARVLRDFDFDVTACADVKEARKAVENGGRVDGLWMDLHLEGIPNDYRNPNAFDGLDLIKLTTQHLNGVPALVCSGFISSEAREKAARLQLDGCIAAWHSKPVDAELVGFDMVRVVNIAFWTRTILPELAHDLVGDTPEMAAIRRNVMKTANPYKLVFPKDRKRFEQKLLDKLAELWSDLEQKLRKRGNQTVIRQSQESAFKLLLDHVPACFERASRSQQALAEHLLHVAVSFESRQVSPEGAHHLMIAARQLGQGELSDEAVFEIKVDLKRYLGIPLGPVLGRSREEVLGSFFGGEG